MTHKIMIIGVVLAFLGLTAYSQTATTVQHKDKSYVVSKQELTETIARLLKDNQSIDDSRLLFRERELRRLIITKQLMQLDMMRLYPMMGGYQNAAPATPSLGYDPNMNTRLNNIENQLQYITGLLTNQGAYRTFNDTGNMQDRYIYDDKESQARDKQLSDQMEALRKAMNDDNSGDITGKDAALAAMLTTLMAQNKALKDQIANIKIPATPMPMGAPQFTGEIKKVFFAHNSTKLDTKAWETIKAVVQQLKDTPSLQVMVKGFASQVGNSAYNHRLSQRRTDAVKSAIVRDGIDPGKVLSSYYGEDVSDNDEAYARRVEILFIDSHIK